MYDAERVKCVADITRAQAATRPDAVAQVFEGRETTYGELDRRASQVAQALIADGCKPDARIGFMGKGSTATSRCSTAPSRPRPWWSASTGASPLRRSPMC